MPTKNAVLVAGVHGVSGRAAAEHWASLPGTQVYGLSRRSAPLPAGVEGISADLLDLDDVQRKLGKIGGITHIVFGAYVEKPNPAERSQTNVAILKNLLDVVEQNSPSLRHITFYQGGKAYGADLGPFKTPAREDDPRVMPPNFYYDQEDFLRMRQRGWGETPHGSATVTVRPLPIHVLLTGRPATGQPWMVTSWHTTVYIVSSLALQHAFAS
jgi:nucleoside-diphosphate-sugar epimerase